MPLQLACISDNNIAVVQYLIDRGAEVNAQRSASAILFFFFYANKWDSWHKLYNVRWSKKHSVDKSQAVAGAIGSTALHVACANGCTKIVDLLLRNGAVVNVKDKYGSTPLDIAAAKHHVEIVRLLELFDTLQENNSSPTERIRRPSLPSSFEGKSSLQIPPISTLPTADPRAPRRSLNMPRREEWTAGIDIHRPPRTTNRTPELASSKSSNESSSDDNSTSRPDYYGYGVVNHYDDENYLLSLERRAFGVEEGRRSLDKPSLHRCSSDGGHLRATALMNAMAAKETNGGGGGEEPTPRPSMVIDDGPEAEALRHFQEKEMKKAWWSAFGGRKSMDVATYHYGNRTPTPENGRKSLDIRPSFDSLSNLAKRSMEGLSRKSIDIQDYQLPDTPNSSRPGFLSRIVGAWTRK